MSGCKPREGIGAGVGVGIGVDGTITVVVIDAIPVAVAVAVDVAGVVGGATTVLPSRCRGSRIGERYVVRNTRASNRRTS